MTSTCSPFFFVVWNHTGVVMGGVEVMNDVSASTVAVIFVGSDFSGKSIDVDVLDGLEDITGVSTP